jgi:hypothetical protein
VRRLAQIGADEASRLEAALERIARASARVAVPAPAQTTTQGGAQAPFDARELAARLDMLIEELRGVLGQS